VVPSPPFEIGAPPFHVWPTGCCTHPILYFKNVSPLFWFLAPLLLYPGDRPGWAHPHLVGGEPDPTIRNKVKVAFLLRPHERGVQQMHRFGVHKSLGGP